MGRALSLVGGFAVLGLGTLGSLLLLRAYVEWSGQGVPPWLVAAVAGLLSMALGWFTLPAWWRGVLLIAPVIGWGGLQLHPGWFLAAAVVILLVQFNAIRHRVPLYRSGRDVIEALSAEIEARRPGAFVDLGCGDALVIAKLARRHPSVRFTGFETAPLLYLWARWRCRSLDNCHVCYRDFWSASWRDYEMAFTFLSPQPMLRVWRKCQREMSAGAGLYSLAFEVPGVAADAVIEAGRFDLMRYAVLVEARETR